MLLNFFTGMVIGLIIAAPIGPIDLLCIHRTLLLGRRAGFVTGLGAAVADAIYGAFAAFGLLSFTAILVDYKTLFHAVGGLFLCGLGIRAFLVKANTEISDSTTTKVSSLSGFFATFFLVLMSPVTILSFVGAFAALGVGVEEARFETALALTLGVFSGSALWWYVLSSFVAFFKHKFNMHNMLWINRLSGGVFIGFGIAALLFVLFFNG